MNSNLYEEFKSHSNQELISIIQQIGAHQPEAIAGAYKHLNERQVSDSEIFGVPHTLQTAVANEDGQKDLLVPYLQETVTKSSNKWINILLSIIAFQFFFQTIYTGWYYHRNNLDYSLLLTYSSIPPFVFVPLLFLLIYKRKKWGWYIFFTVHLINIFTTTGLYGKGLISGFTDDLYSVLAPAFFGAISIFVTYVLWKEVAHDFAVSKANKRQTLIVGIFLGVFVLITRYIQT